VPKILKLQFLRSVPLAVLFAATLGPAASLAQPSLPSLQDSASYEPPGPAALIFNHDTITVFRSPLGRSSPAQRVERALVRLEMLRPPGMSAPVRVEVYSDARAVFVGDRFEFAIVEGDVDPHLGLTLDEVAEAARARLGRALETRARLWEPAPRWRSIVLALLATAVLILLFPQLRRARLSVLRRLEADAPKLADEGLQRRASQGIRWILSAITIVVGLFLIGLWAVVVMNRFPETEPWGNAARGFLLDMLGAFARATLQALPGLVTAAVIFSIGLFATRIADDLFAAVEHDRIHPPGVHPETAGATRRIVNTLLWMFTLIIMYPFLPGSRTDAFKGVSVLAGLLLTLGSAGIVSHMMSGLVLVFSRALRAGDYVRVGEVEGVVIQVGTLATKIANRKDEEFTIPNAVMVGTTVKNFSRLAREHGAPLTTSVTIGYDAPWRVVHEMLLAAAAKTAGLRQEPAPLVLQTSLSDFNVEYQVVARLEDASRRILVMNELHQNIQDAFNERGVQIMSPHFVSQPGQPVLVPKLKWSESPLPRPREDRT